MQAIRSILVVMEPDHPENLALNRARLISCVTQSHLHLLVIDTKRDHSQFLNQVAADLKADGFTVTTQQAFKDTPHQTIMHVQMLESCGLVIKQHFADNPLKKALLTPDDWKLLRYCPCPVLMVKTDRPWIGGLFLAAVDVGNKDGEHQTLHKGIVNAGVQIAEFAKGELHVIAAHPSPMLSAADPTFQISESIKAAYQAKCQEFQDLHGIDEQHLHIEEGPADVLIAHTAHKLNAVVTIIGTVARTGFTGALIGNTAEVVLDQLETDVLVIKPDDILDRLEDVVAQR